MKKKQYTYTVEFHGKTKIKGTSYNNAVENLANKLKKGKSIIIHGAEIPKTIYIIGKSLLINIGAIVTGIILIGVIFAWKSLVETIQTLPENLQLIGALLMFIVIITTMKFPIIIGTFFDGLGRDYK